MKDSVFPFLNEVISFKELVRKITSKRGTTVFKAKTKKVSNRRKQRRAKNL